MRGVFVLTLSFLTHFCRQILREQSAAVRETRLTGPDSQQIHYCARLTVNVSMPGSASEMIIARLTVSVKDTII